MLELGCGDGTSLVAAAVAAPQSEFLGVDLAARPIAAANELAAEVGARNARFVVGDVAQPDPAWGTFDYIAAHGVYSWIPPEVRDAMMATIARLLRPDGVAYVSYAAYPGCYARHMLRQVLLFHTRAIADGDAKAQEGHNLLRFLAAARTKRDDPWEDWLREEIDEHLEFPPAFLRHDDLATINDPAWFHEFARHAARHGLRWLGEADWLEDCDRAFPPEVQAMLAQVPDRTTREQYRDILKFRRFRQSLLVHADRTPCDPPRIEPIARMSVAAPVRREGDAKPLAAKELETYATLKGARVTTDSRIGRAALAILAQRDPRPIPFGELYERASARVAEACGGAVPTPQDAQELLELVAAFHDVGLAKLHRHVAPCAERAAERPVASPVARWFAARGRRVVTLFQNTLELQDERSRVLLTLLDGTRDRTDLLAALRQAESAQNLPQPAEAPPLTAELLDRSLERMAHIGLLLR
jgi:SAM-dependent methyltransferase